MHHMSKVICPLVGESRWANSCKAKKTTNGWTFDYRCTKCGQTGHTAVKDGR